MNNQVKVVVDDVNDYVKQEDSANSHVEKMINNSDKAVDKQEVSTKRDIQETVNYTAEVTAVQDVFLTPCSLVQNKFSSKTNHILVVTPPYNVSSDTVLARVVDDKGDNSDEHNNYIDNSSVNQMVIVIRDTNDNDGNEGTGDDLVGDTWDKLLDLEIIC